ncbi:hypothetical protein ACFY36_02330 [Actinoplanes sp. NPDC000266]
MDTASTSTLAAGSTVLPAVSRRELTVHFESFALPGDDDQSLTLSSAEPGSPSEEALRMLASAYSPKSA